MRLSCHVNSDNSIVGMGLKYSLLNVDKSILSVFILSIKSINNHEGMKDYCTLRLEKAFTDTFMTGTKFHPSTFGFYGIYDS